MRQIRKTPNGNYQVRWERGGKRGSETFATEAEALAYRAEMERALTRPERRITVRSTRPIAGSLRHLPTGRWQLRFRRDGKACARTFETRAAAEAFGAGLRASTSYITPDDGEALTAVAAQFRSALEKPAPDLDQVEAAYRRLRALVDRLVES